MANDRMYIRCKGCGKCYFLAKCYSNGYYVLEEEELFHNLNVFFDEHKFCNSENHDGYDYPDFELVYESEQEDIELASRTDDRYVNLPKYNRESYRPWIVRLMNKILKKWKIVERV